MRTVESRALANVTAIENLYTLPTYFDLFITILYLLGWSTMELAQLLSEHEHERGHSRGALNRIVTQSRIYFETDAN